MLKRTAIPELTTQFQCGPQLICFCRMKVFPRCIETSRSYGAKVPLSVAIKTELPLDGGNHRRPTPGDHHAQVITTDFKGTQNFPLITFIHRQSAHSGEVCRLLLAWRMRQKAQVELIICFILFTFSQSTTAGPKTVDFREN